MKYKLFIPILVALGVSACMNWLDVQPKTSVKEEKLFSREDGFKEVLTGIYVQLTEKNLYGRNLTYGFIDQLGQRYNDQTKENLYKFPSTFNESQVNSIWGSMYNVIANINNLLSWIERRPEVLVTEDYHDIIKGEALGLRAFLYFDLLRMWGPVYKVNQNKLSVPYRTVFSREDKDLIPANELLANIEKDLKEAEHLLANDPMHIVFPAFEEKIPGDPFLLFRLKRINLYAVKAMLARTALWRGDKNMAMEYAGQVINAKDARNNQRFKLVLNNAADRIYSTEIIFSLSIDQFADQITSDFSLGGKYVVEEKKRIYAMFNTDEDGLNDFRVREGQGFIFDASSGYCNKFNQNGLSSFVLANTMPLIRLSEMYLIMCECEDNPEAAGTWLSAVRDARGISEVAGEMKARLLEIEYRKEFYGEGQYWYFLKRNFKKTFLDCPLKNGMLEENYCFSIPSSEVELGTITIDK